MTQAEQPRQPEQVREPETRPSLDIVDFDVQIGDAGADLPVIMRMHDRAGVAFELSLTAKMAKRLGFQLYGLGLAMTTPPVGRLDN